MAFEVPRAPTVTILCYVSNALDEFMQRWHQTTAGWRWEVDEPERSASP
jgi:hypothetical protein